MLPKKERLKDRYLFNLTFKKKNKLASNLLLLYYLLNRKDINDLPKTAFIVGLSIDKRATKRNLIKRRMRAAYTLIKKKIESLNKTSVLIWIAKEGVKNATFKQIKESMEFLLKKLVIFKNTYNSNGSLATMGKKIC